MSVSRRGFLAVAGGAGALLALAACGQAAPAPAAPGAGSSAGSSSAAPAGPWTFTDDRGKKIDLPRRPARVVAQVGSAAALWDFGVRPIAIFGPHRLKSGERDPQVGNVDITKVTGLGNVWDEFNVEQYISLQPELLVSSMYVKGTLWYVPEKSKDTIEQVAPTAGIMLTGQSATQVIEKYAELARSLGADLDAPEVSSARTRFEAANGELKKISETGLKVLMMSGGPDTMWVVNPPEYPDIKHLTETGLDVVTPDKVDDGGFFQSLSWENADKYDADVILYDSRTQALKLEEMMKKPTFAKLPAVRAGHVYPWRAEAPFSYQGYADYLEELVANLKKAGEAS
ncbi:iron complex transport system substrate-binding protein [Streptosporangium becharense]|uniref:Iron complex transport system substrate-binding protein n=1 Tax=Streptosporangium becharense TaxID=1816182 RepID=A0A7W9MJ46_9ACTN|nr:ABC transporter substrate-binding protein [Streptosporangium becharense]MBB2911497.1 iron complex transport system substrate-binding protein [Streptosporangium becharense]MBB5822685.1 iron complex transport system substrate-binding protein [Streptosporangium becharense]